MPHPWKSWDVGAPPCAPNHGSARRHRGRRSELFLAQLLELGKAAQLFGHRSSSPWPCFLIISADLAQAPSLPTGCCLHSIPGSALGKLLEEQPSHPRGDVGMAGVAASPQTFPCSAVPASSTARNGRGQGTRDRGQVKYGSL